MLFKKKWKPRLLFHSCLTIITIYDVNIFVRSLLTEIFSLSRSLTSL